MRPTLRLRDRELAVSLKAGLATGALALAGFTLVHVLFIAPVVLAMPDGETPPALRVVGLTGTLVLGTPLLFVTGPMTGLAWHAIRVRRGRLPSWRFGATFAAFTAPVLLFGLAFGPVPEDAFSGVIWYAVVPPLAAAFVAGAALGGAAGAIGLGLSAGLVAFMLTPFALGSDVRGWAGLFLAAALAVFVASGAVMERVRARFAAREARRAAP